MKKYLLSLAIFLTLSSSVFAFVPQMSFFVNGQSAVARIWNNTPRTFVCSGTAFGQTYAGYVADAWFSNVYITPGMSADVYVHTNFYDPFINVWAQTDCQFTR